MQTATSPYRPAIRRLHHGLHSCAGFIVANLVRIPGQPIVTVLTFILLLTCVITQAHAIPVTVSFAVSGFRSDDGEVPPTDPVVGSIVYDAASITSNINSLTSVNLTIAGHTYTIGE